MTPRESLPGVVAGRPNARRDNQHGDNTGEQREERDRAGKQH
jgi:hypothetical protein